MLTIFLIFRLEPKPKTHEDVVINSIKESHDVVKIPIEIEDHNKINREINNIQSKIIVTTWENEFRFKVRGSLSYEKFYNFRLKLNSIMGDELDIGSNKEVFWYWSKRDKYPGVYFSKYQDYHKTRLKNPFNPIFMRDTLGVDEIDVKDSKITETPEKLIITWKRINACNEQIIYSKFLNRVSKRVDLISISSLDGIVLCYCDVVYDNMLPKKIIYHWREENRVLTMDFQNIIVNSEINNSNWNVPNYKDPLIDMGKN